MSQIDATSSMQVLVYPCIDSSGLKLLCAPLRSIQRITTMLGSRCLQVCQNSLSKSNLSGPNSTFQRLQYSSNETKSARNHLAAAFRLSRLLCSIRPIRASLAALADPRKHAVCLLYLDYKYEVHSHSFCGCQKDRLRKRRRTLT